ncbi:MAG: hypothetical protein Q9208_005885 [Pyrenodesmia sp. 3 TL-2023]
MDHDTAARAHLHKRKAEIFELEKRQQINCTNPNALFFEDCWDILKIQDYLVAPETGWINTIRTCQDSGGNTWDNDGSTCCVAGEAWSTCYLRMAIPGSSSDCTSASGGRCSESMLDNIDVAPEVRPFVRYTVKNIYADNEIAINNFFLTYYQSLYNAAGIVGNNIEQMIQIVDVLVEPSFTLQAILLSLAVGLAFLGAPSFAQGILSWQQKWLSGSVQAFVISAQQAPNVGRALFPVGTDTSQRIQTADLHIQLTNITHQMSDMMDGGVRLLMTDIGTFVNYAANGRYSGPNVTNTGEGTGLTVPSGTDALAYALKTYLLSYSMGVNRWYAFFDLGPYTSKEEVAQQFKCEWDEPNNICKATILADKEAIWWSPYTYRVYFLRCDGPKEAKKPYEMVKTINQYGWAPLDVLFDGAYNCTAEGRAGTNNVNFNYDGTLDLACVSQLPMVVGCLSMCPVALVNDTCLFKDIGTIIEGECDQWDGWLN